MGLSLDVTRLIERLCDAVSNRCERDRHICKDVLSCIHKEKPNFERIIAEKPYGKSPLEPRARTQYSFEKTSEAFNELSHVWKFRTAARKGVSLCKLQLSRPADEREAEELLALINALEPRLERRIGHSSATDEGASPF